MRRRRPRGDFGGVAIVTAALQNVVRRSKAGALEITTSDGRTYEREQKIAFGNPAKPMSWEDLSEKFVDCAENAAGTLSGGQIAAAIEMLTNLEKVDEIGDVAIALGSRR